jgi:hypothetical protein
MRLAGNKSGEATTKISNIPHEATRQLRKPSKFGSPFGLDAQLETTTQVSAQRNMILHRDGALPQQTTM